MNSSNIIIILMGVGAFTLFLVKPFRQWMGKEENHNSAIVLIAFVGLIVALPIFSKQVSNIQVKVDSIEESIKGIYGSYLLETFGYEELKDSFVQNASGTVVRIKLSHRPTLKSVNVWEGPMSVNPSYFKVDGDILDVETIFDAASFKEAADSGYRYTVTYIPDNVR